MDCGVFAANRIMVKRAMKKWRRGVQYEELPALRLKEANDLCDRENDEEFGEEEMVFSRPKNYGNGNVTTVVVGKERRVFKVDPEILDDELFRSLREKTAEKNDFEGVLLLEHCDSILFEHILWLLYNDDDPSLLRVNLEELIEFYAQDAT